MENQKALSSTQLELIRLVMKPASEAEIISEMQKIIHRFEENKIGFGFEKQVFKSNFREIKN
jgi:hypothetical protein